MPVVDAGIPALTLAHPLCFSYDDATGISISLWNMALRTRGSAGP